MLIYTITKLSTPHAYIFPRILLAHTKTCPARKRPVCPATSSKESSKGPADPGATGSTEGGTIKRGEPGKVRLGFIPDNWFLFFHSRTGVSGPYLFGILLVNYCLSKEIFVMEHEYYVGLSIFVITYIAATKFGADVGKYFDSQVDAISNELEKGRKNVMSGCELAIKEAEDMQVRANGQKVLIDAKKENVAMQLEAVYRERMMHVYNTVKGRMEYHVKRNRVENRIHQKWMLDWILDNVRKSITPDFEKQALSKAIEDLAAMAGKA